MDKIRIGVVGLVAIGLQAGADLLHVGVDEHRVDRPPVPVVALGAVERANQLKLL